MEEHLRVRRGDTFARLLARHGVASGVAEAWIQAIRPVFDPRRLRPNHALSLRFEARTRELLAMRYEIDRATHLVAQQTAKGIRARRQPLPLFTEVRGAAGSIARGLWRDAVEAGVPPLVVSELADIFGWEVNLARDLQRGDEFRVLYESSWQAGATWERPGRVLGAELVTRGEPITAIFFEDAPGSGAYYTPSGDPLSRDLLRYPVEFTRISSEFSHSRRHPILRFRRPHLGVDFAAPAGTPVRAVADATVVQAGWASQLGRCVRLDHGDALETSYGHLSRLARGIRRGVTVRRGQVIGYVGSSGLATGPHLHFAIHRDGMYVDPLSVSAGTQRRIPERVRPAFERVQSEVRRQLAELSSGVDPVAFSDVEDTFRVWAH